ncbi:MAG: helix-turn-helix transcriptional regulator [bacterium]|nr:helix-turn-helix transcriptional regulator [bacterium]
MSKVNLKESGKRVDKLMVKERAKKNKIKNIQKIGDRAIAIRKSLHLNQKEMSEAIDIPSSNLSELERGKIAPGYNYLFRLSNRFNVNLNFLFHGTGKMFTSQKQKKARGLDDEKTILNRINTVEDMEWFIENSPLLRNHLIAAAAAFRYNNEEMIAQDVKINRIPEEE